jgi:hypothetical protein
MATVAVNPPKTPVTKGSNGMATATLPNVCKMPPPPPPFCPTPLPNIGMSGKNPQKYTTTVKVEGQPVAIQGASFDSVGDIASKATGGGVVSNNAEGPTTFIALGALDTKFEGKDVQFLGDQMLNNCGPPGAPANSACNGGELQAPLPALQVLTDIAKFCNETTPPEKNGKKKSCTKLGEDKHKCCEGKIKEHQKKNPPKGNPPVDGEQGYQRPPLDSKDRPVPNPDGSFPAPVPTGGPRPNLGAAFKQGGTAIRAAFAALKGNCYPDAAIINPDGSKTFVDFKFACPPGHPSGKGTSKGGGSPTMSSKQQGSYDSLGFGTGNGPAITICP